MKISKHFQPQNVECINNQIVKIKLNHFKHINILEICKQPGIHNKSSNFIPEMVSCVEMKIQGFFCKKNIRGSIGTISIHCEVSKNKCYVSAMWPFENM